MIRTPQSVRRFAAWLLLTAAVGSPFAVLLASRNSTPVSEAGPAILTADGGVPSPPPAPISPGRKTY
jgi:hypothetical protein